MKKRTTSVALTALLCLSACAGGDDVDDEPKASASSTTSRSSATPDDTPTEAAPSASTSARCDLTGVDPMTTWSVDLLEFEWETIAGAHDGGLEHRPSDYADFDVEFTTLQSELPPACLETDAYLDFWLAWEKTMVAVEDGVPPAANIDEVTTTLEAWMATLDR